MTLQNLREEIDRIDCEILSLLGRRLAVAKKIAGIKKTNDLPILDSARESEIREKVRKMALEHHLSPAVMEDLFHLLLDYTRLEMERG